MLLRFQTTTSQQKNQYLFCAPNLVIDNRKKRILRLLQETKSKKPKDLEKINSLRKQLYQLKYEEFQG